MKESLTPQEKNFLKSLSSPEKIQDYLDSIPFNHEKTGETCRSARGIMVHKTAHCLEGAFLACAALIMQNKKPLILNLKVKESDYDHVITLYKENNYWGSISKTNHAVLGFRDPVYKTIRELAMSYFHEYFLVSTGEKTLLGYSRPINIKRFGASWITSEMNLFPIAVAIAKLPYSPTVPKKNKDYIRLATALERKTASISYDK